MLSLPATKGFEFGSGFEGIKIPGSKHNDAFYYDENFGRLRTETNNSGGIKEESQTVKTFISQLPSNRLLLSVKNKKLLLTMVKWCFGC